MKNKGAKMLDVNSQSRIAGSSADEREKIVIFIVQKSPSKMQSAVARNTDYKKRARRRRELRV